MTTGTEISQVFRGSSGGYLGTTIEEKTRNLLGWTESDRNPTCAPPVFSTAFTTQPMTPLMVKTPSSAKKDRSRKPKTPQRAAVYPYSLVPEGRTRKSSISSVSSSSSTSGDSVLKQQLTPPPSPAASVTITSNANVTIVSLPRTAQTRMAIPTETQRNRGTEYGTLPISPVSPNTPNPYAILTKAPITPSTSAPSQQVFERIRELIPNVPTDNNAYKILVQTATSVIELEHKLENIIQEKEKYKSILECRRQNFCAFSPDANPPSHSVGAPLPLMPNQANCRIGTTPVASPSYPVNPFFGTAMLPRRDSTLPNSAPNLQLNRTQWTESQPGIPSCSVPDDLFHVDVSAFRSLVTSPTSALDQGHGGHFPGGHVPGNWQENPSLSVDMDPLTVDTAPSLMLYC